MRRPTCSDPANVLLPWYANGSLEAEEEAAVRTHVGACPTCAGELDALAEIARSLSLHGMPGSDIERPSWTERRSGRAGYFVAAVLVLPAILGLYWIYLGLPGRVAIPGGGRAAALRATAMLDLGAGPMRGDIDVPTLVVSPRVAWVALRFLLPAVPEARLTVELQDSSGRQLTQAEEVSHDDQLRCTYSFPVDLVADSGEFAILLRETGPTSPRSYRFPFRVGFVPR